MRQSTINDLVWLAGMFIYFGIAYGVSELFDTDLFKTWVVVMLSASFSMLIRIKNGQ